MENEQYETACGVLVTNQLYIESNGFYEVDDEAYQVINQNIESGNLHFEPDYDASHEKAEAHSND